MAHPIRASINARIDARALAEQNLALCSRTPRLLASASLLTVAFVATGTQAVAQEAAVKPAYDSTPPGSQVSAPDDAFQIRFRADTLVITPVLDAALVNSERSVVAGSEAHFQTYSNYPTFIASGEVRVFKAGASPDGEPLARLNVDQNGAAFWKPPVGANGDLFYVYRVVGKDGKFDETTPRELTVVDPALAKNMDFGSNPARPDFGQIDHAARRTIGLSGLMATVTGRADPHNDTVRVSGQPVPVDDSGRFVSQQIVSRADGELTVEVNRGGKTIKTQSQSFAAAKDDWFVVGQGDLTLGKSTSSGPARQVSGDSLADGSYAIGRAAFYAKGVTTGDVQITASLDTGETLVKDLLSNLDRKDPRQLLRRMNSEQYYPTYGDDSTLVEDAPTQGRFYLRAQKDASQLVVGNFVTQVTGTELAPLERGLFGALLDVNSKSTTSFGERKGQIMAFASDPGTVPGREEFRGTGGSLYFLKRQDVSVGSERVRMEVRDSTTGIVLESHDLNPQQDYDFDPVQGRLTLLKPLGSIVATGATVREGSTSGNVPVLVVRYEYTPPIGTLSGYTVGGRASTWLGETVRLGLTAQRDTVQQADQTMLGGDVTVRIAAGTYAKAELAQTKGLGFDQSSSVDGGLSFTDIANPGSNVVSRAWRSEFAVDFAELAHRQGDMGKVSAYYEHQDQGFAAAGRLTPSALERWGLAGSVPLGESGSLSAKYDQLTTAANGSNRTGSADLVQRFDAGTGQMTAKLGLRFDDRAPGVLYNSVQQGKRLDGAIELGFKPRRGNWEVSAFGQATLDRDVTRLRNDRAGLGLKAELAERLSFDGELSGGDGGLGANMQLNHRLTNGSEAYVGYALFADRTDTAIDPQNLFTRSNRGTLTVGARQRFSDSLSVFGENKIGIGGNAPSLLRSFGLRYEPAKHLSVTGAFENGYVDDATTGLLRRTAASMAVGYTGNAVRIGSAIEMRTEKGADRDQTVWLWRNNLSYAVNPDWRLLGELNLARADASSASIPAAEYTQAMAGLAYRPVGNDRLNALLRMQYYVDLGPVGQVTGSGQTQSPKQKSAIVSLDVNYDLSRHVTVGAKYGYRQGRVSLTRESAEFARSDAHLAVVRLDYTIAKQWDVLAEGRRLWVTQANDSRWGALGAIYRHLGNNVKVGVGYSVSDFSDDLTDQSYSSRGPFINLIGKF